MFFAHHAGIALCFLRYDGVRAQVHLKADGSLRFFSRSSKDSSSELPDLIPVMKVGTPGMKMHPCRNINILVVTGWLQDYLQAKIQ